MNHSTQNSPRPRVLYLSFDVAYIDPTRQLFTKVLEQGCDVVKFGPGFVSLEEVAAGPDRFADNHGPFDIVIGDQQALLRPGSVPEERKSDLQFLYHACKFDPLLIHEGARYYTFLRNFKGPRLIALFQLDYYNLRPDFIEMLEEVGDYYITWGEEFILPKSAIDFDAIPSVNMNRKIYKAWNDNYYHFLCRKPDRIISAPQFVDESEVYGGRLAPRRWDWAAPGANYDSRVIARDVLDKAGIAQSGRLLPYYFVVADKIGLNVYNKYWALKFLNWAFLNSLRMAKFAFTCGGVMRWAIRKFYEIPASGAVMVAEPCEGFSALGFKDKVNSVGCDPADIMDAHHWLKGDLDRAQAIADAGRELVLRRHSTGARARQMDEAFRRIHARTFTGSYWQDGAFHLRPSNAAQVASITHPAVRT